MIALSNLAPHVCAPRTPIHDVVRRIDEASPYLFQVVVDADGRILGTVTDGDIRRAMLRGVNLHDPVSACMHTPPRVGHRGQDALNRQALRSAHFLPVVDDNGAVKEILVVSDSEARIHQAIVMAGGFGTRLGDLTKETPKPLLPIGGRPILDRILTQLEDAGITQVHISVHYLANRVRDFIATRHNRATISFIEESEPLGTAGALGQIDYRPSQPVLVMNGDVVTQVDFQALCRLHDRHRHDGTLAVSPFEVQVPFGVVRQNAEGLFDGIDEKPKLEYFVSAGIYYLSPEFFSLVPRGKRMDMPDLLSLGARAGLRIGLFPVHEYWMDVGRPDDLATAHRDHDPLIPINTGK
jgi:dTDP-glucose pyrophosphorylase